MAALAYSPEQESLVWQARLTEAVGGSFEAFLHFVAIQDIRGGSERLPWLPEGSPLERGAIRLQRWPYLMKRARAWERKDSEVILKARQLGFTWLAAAYTLFCALAPGARALVISKGLRDAYAFLERVQFIHLRLPAELRPNLTIDNFGQKAFAGGGEILALPSTKDAGRGFTGSLLVFDENAFHVWASANWRAARATVADQGQTLVMSTGNGASGHFHDLYRQAEGWERELAEMARQLAVAEDAGDEVTSRRIRGAMEALRRAVLTPVFVEALERPDRSEEWLEAERRVYVGLADEFNAEYPRTVEHAFIQLRGLVYPQFDPDIHVVEGPHPVAWERCDLRWAAYDLGGGDPTAIGFYGAYRRPGDVWRIHQYAEWASREVLSAERAYSIMQPWHERAPLNHVACDPREPTLQQTLRQVYGLPAEVANWARGEGLGLVAAWLDAGTLTISGECEESIREFGVYRWLEKTDPNDKQRYATSTPAWTHGDHHDARRYGLVWAHYVLLGEDDEPARARARY